MNQLKQYDPNERDAQPKELRLYQEQHRIYLVDRYTGSQVAKLGWFDADGWNAEYGAKQIAERKGYTWPFLSACDHGGVPTYTTPE